MLDREKDSAVFFPLADPVPGWEDYMSRRRQNNPLQLVSMRGGFGGDKREGDEIEGDDDESEKKRVQLEWQAGKLKIITATVSVELLYGKTLTDQTHAGQIAFGMGIDKADGKHEGR